MEFQKTKGYYYTILEIDYFSNNIFDNYVIYPHYFTVMWDSLINIISKPLLKHSLMWNVNLVQYYKYKKNTKPSIIHIYAPRVFCVESKRYLT